MVSQADMPETALHAEEGLQRLERRHWYLWTVAIIIILLLSFAVFSFAMTHRGTGSVWIDTEQIAVRSLMAFVLVFIVFAVHRQIVINKLRRQLLSDAHLMTVLQARAELFHKLAILDPLTGLYNRRFAMQHLPSEMARAERHQYKLTVIAFDLNGLKQINDSYGHAVGDLVLREFASALKRATRSSDVAVRMGGDEFLIILPECHIGDLPRVLGRLDNLVVTYRDQKIEVHYGAGWAEYIYGESVQQLLDRADEQLYSDKNSGAAERKAQAARELRRHSEKLTTMGLLTSSVAHDFNNLLTVIKGYAAVILEHGGANPEILRQVNEIQMAAERASSMTGQLLAFSRKQAVEPKILDLNQLVNGMRFMLKRLTGDKITQIWEPGVDVHNVRVDVGQMEQILMNLVANARDAMPNGGTLEVRTGNCEIDEMYCENHRGARIGTYAWVSVKDTGVGMDPDVRNRVFEPFFTTKGPGHGTGLGLSTAYGIVKQNGGYIWVESEHDKGTCVTVFLPKAKTTEEEMLASVEEEEIVSHVDDSGAPAVLVVENFNSLRFLMCDYLREAGYEVLEAGYGEQAIRYMTENREKIGVLVVDTILPGMSGLELAEILKEQNPGMKVLFVTGYIEDMQLFAEWQKSNDYFLTAPFTGKEFVDALNRLANPKRKAEATAGSA